MLNIYAGVLSALLLGFGPCAEWQTDEQQVSIKRLIKKKATKYGLEWELVAAVIWQESRGNPWAYRVEPAFYRRYIESTPRDQLPGYFPDFPPNSASERAARATSLGLMQIMGNTARMVGYKKRELTRLCVPAINLEYGCRYLKQCINRADGGSYQEKIKGGLAAYNTGRTAHENTNYDEKVLRHVVTGDYNQMFE